MYLAGRYTSREFNEYSLLLFTYQYLSLPKLPLSSVSYWILGTYLSYFKHDYKQDRQMCLLAYNALKEGEGEDAYYRMLGLFVYNEASLVVKSAKWTWNAYDRSIRLALQVGDLPWCSLLLLSLPMPMLITREITLDQIIDKMKSHAGRNLIPTNETPTDRSYVIKMWAYGLQVLSGEKNS